MLLAVFSEEAHRHTHFIRQALLLGYDVRVLTRSPERLAIQHSQLGITAGNSEDKSLVHKLVSEADAVVCLFKEYTASGVENIVTAMQQYDVRRCILFSEEIGAPEVVQHDRGLLKRALHVSPAVGHVDGIDLVRRSGRDWTIVHPSGQTGAPQSHGHVDLSADTYEKVRDNFTNFIIGQIADATYIAKVLTI